MQISVISDDISLAKTVQAYTYQKPQKHQKIEHFHFLASK
jgi:hypothetical protein